MFIRSMVVATCVKTESRSWIRYRGASFSGKGVSQLLCRPGRSWMPRDCHVDNSSPIVRQDDEDEKQPKCDCRDDEEVGSHDLAHVI